MIAAEGGQEQSGVVTAFDFDAGLGTVAWAGGRDYRFHCTQIADGSRFIEVGTAVRFQVAAGRGGVWEAAGLAPGG